MTLGTQFPKEMPNILKSSEQPRRYLGVGRGNRCLWKRRHFRAEWWQRVSGRGMGSLWGHLLFLWWDDLWRTANLSPHLRQDPWSRLLWDKISECGCDFLIFVPLLSSQSCSRLTRLDGRGRHIGCSQWYQPLSRSPCQTLTLGAKGSRS